jgi:hypothetical protein
MRRAAKAALMEDFPCCRRWGRCAAALRLIALLRISQDRRKGRLRQHLDVIRRRRVERAVAADPNNGPAIGENDFRGLRRAPRRFRNRGRDVRWDAVDLTGMEQGERAQQWNLSPQTQRVYVEQVPGSPACRRRDNPSEDLLMAQPSAEPDRLLGPDNSFRHFRVAPHSGDRIVRGVGPTLFADGSVGVRPVEA